MKKLIFSLGEKVRWSSQAGGFSKVKEGIIVDVIPANQRPDQAKYPKLYRSPGIGGRRDHESYVVMVDKEPYWPRVSQLEKTVKPKTLARSIVDYLSSEDTKRSLKSSIGIDVVLMVIKKMCQDSIDDEIRDTSTVDAYRKVAPTVEAVLGKILELGDVVPFRNDVQTTHMMVSGIIKDDGT